MLRLAAVAAVIGLSLAHQELNCADFKGPCNGRDYKGRQLECPKYKSGRKLFRDLYRYITGSNVGGVKIAMTAPVLVGRYSDTCPGKAMLFFAPYKYQRGKSLPKPTESDVSIVYFPPLTFAVRCYSGYLMWSKRAEKRRTFHIDQLYNSLDRDGVDYIPHEALSAIYDSPMRFEGRHNEAWVLLQNEAASDA